MIKIKEIEIQLPKWWQTGLIIIATLTVGIITLKVEPERILKLLEQIIQLKLLG